MINDKIYNVEFRRDDGERSGLEETFYSMGDAEKAAEQLRAKGHTRVKIIMMRDDSADIRLEF